MSTDKIQFLFEQDEIELKPDGFKWVGWNGVLPIKSRNQQIFKNSGKVSLIEQDVVDAAKDVARKSYDQKPKLIKKGTVISAEILVTGGQQKYLKLVENNEQPPNCPEPSRLT